MAWIVRRYKGSTGGQKEIFGDGCNCVLSEGGVSVAISGTSRFEGDRLFARSEGSLAVLDGVLLNKSELYEQYGVGSMAALFEAIGGQKEYWSLFRGPFSGFRMDMNSGELRVYGNQTGDTAAFYYNGAGMCAASSDFNMLWELCRAEGIELRFDPVYADNMLSLGYAVEGHTVCRELRRTQPGMYAVLGDGGASEAVYHRFVNDSPLDISLDDAIELVDAGFRKAVKRCFDKDLEYGYSHLADMSGGLDSRTTNWVAADMGYKDITNICYAKSGSDEQHCAQAASLALGNSFLFRPQDDLKFFFDLETTVKANYGLALYFGITSGRRLLSDLNFRKFGLEHTGQLGDVVIGSYCKGDHDDSVVDPVLIGSSDILAPSLEHAGDYKSHELFTMYYRGFFGMLSSHFIRRKYTEAVAPHIDADFLQLCLTIPLEYRKEHKLYWAWLRKKYPRALEVPSTRRIAGRDGVSWRSIARKLVGKYKRQVYALLVKLGMVAVANKPNTMNPLDYWYNTRQDVRDFMQAYYDGNIGSFDYDPQLRELISTVYNGVRCADKCVALTVLAAYRLYIKNGAEK